LGYTGKSFISRGIQGAPRSFGSSNITVASPWYAISQVSFQLIFQRHQSNLRYEVQTFEVFRGV
jgi:hypothetical protein